MSTMTEALPLAHETDVTAKAQRRRFTTAEKLRVLREADRCTKPGELSALLRREGLYSSHLSTWRAARSRGELAGLTPRARGPKAKPVAPRDEKLVEQARDVPAVAGEVANPMTLEPDAAAIGAVRASCDADLGHERPGCLSGSSSGFGREESAERAAG